MPEITINFVNQQQKWVELGTDFYKHKKLNKMLMLVSPLCASSNLSHSTVMSVMFESCLSFQMKQRVNNLVLWRSVNQRITAPDFHWTLFEQTFNNITSLISGFRYFLSRHSRSGWCVVVDRWPTIMYFLYEYVRVTNSPVLFRKFFEWAFESLEVLTCNSIDTTTASP